MRHCPYGAWISCSVATILIAAAAQAQAVPASGESRPWWDDLPRIVQVGHAETAQRMNASCVMCGAADDPTWGLYGQRVRMNSCGDRVEQIHAAGMKAITWFEAFGTAGSIYAAQLKRNPNGDWIKSPTDPTLTRVFLNHWAWQLFDGSGELRWIGAHNYFNDEDFARPYTRTHPRYGCPPMTYPDGTVATGYHGPASDPRNSRIYDAGCSKDVFGNVTFTHQFNAKVNEIDPATGKARGPTGGLLEFRGKYASLVSPGKDSACPAWIDYARASVRQALDAGIDGLWCDNFSPWDSFSARPLAKAFGEWSVATFRDHLRKEFTAKERVAMGVADVDSFDVRDYLRRRCREWGGTVDTVGQGELKDPFDPNAHRLREPKWRDARWLDDPVWRAYLIHKRRTGTKALDAYYAAIKDEAAAAGKPDFLVSGNDLPNFGLGWVRGQLDMVSTELAWGWGLASGARGFMPPPLGSFVPVYKLAREHAKSRFVNVWMYVPKEQWHKPNIANVLYYQALANHTLPMPHPGNSRTVGDEETAGTFLRFVRSAAPTSGNRTRVAEVGLYYSSSSQLMQYTPGGVLNHNNQPHMFAHWGWGTALSWLHHQYRAVPEWKLSLETLKGLRLLVIPSAEVFPAEDLAVLENWVRSGGALVIAGDCGSRLGEAGNFGPCLTGSTLAALMVVEGGPRPLGRGKVLTLREDPGFSFYKATEERPALLAGLARTLARVCPPENASLRAAEVSWKVGLTLYQDRSRLFIDVNNTDIDLGQDVIGPAPPITFTVALPLELRGKDLRAQVLSPDIAPQAELTLLGDGRVEVSLGSVQVYASVLIEPKTQEKR